MSATSEYQEMGGLPGFAARILRQQLEEAAVTPGHLFAGVADAFKTGDFERASACFVQVLVALPNEWPLGAVRTVFVTIPNLQAAAREAVEFARSGEFPENYPLKLAVWGGIGLEISERNKRAAQAPRPKKIGRQRMIAAMRLQKAAGHALKEFVRAIRQGSIENLRVEGDDLYIFDIRGEDECEYKATTSALEKCWQEA